MALLHISWCCLENESRKHCEDGWSSSWVESHEEEDVVENPEKLGGDCEEDQPQQARSQNRKDKQRDGSVIIDYHQNERVAPWHTNPGQTLNAIRRQPKSAFAPINYCAPRIITGNIFHSSASKKFQPLIFFQNVVPQLHLFDKLQVWGLNCLNFLCIANIKAECQSLILNSRLPLFADWRQPLKIDQAVVKHWGSCLEGVPRTVSGDSHCHILTLLTISTATQHANVYSLQYQYQNTESRWLFGIWTKLNTL